MTETNDSNLDPTANICKNTEPLKLTFNKQKEWAGIVQVPLCLHEKEFE